MNNLRDYYERALQEFGTSDDGNHSLKAFNQICSMVTGFFCFDLSGTNPVKST